MAKTKYETHVRPFLNMIAEWYKTMNEEQIARTLGISLRTFQYYKAEHKELQDCLQDIRLNTIAELKSKLKAKAMGYEYTETKTILRMGEDGREYKVIEKYTKYAHPDTAAINLLLKNYDETWHNDDSATLKIKQDQVEIAKKKAEQAEW